MAFVEAFVVEVSNILGSSHLGLALRNNRYFESRESQEDGWNFPGRDQCPESGEMSMIQVDLRLSSGDFGFVDLNESQNLNMISENVTECQDRCKWMSMTQLGVTVPRKLWKNSLKISICSNNIMSSSPCQHTAWVSSLNWSHSLQLIQLSWVVVPVSNTTALGSCCKNIHKNVLWTPYSKRTCFLRAVAYLKWWQQHPYNGLL